MTTSPSLITEPAPSFWAEQDRVIDSPPILRARPEDGRHDQLGIFQTALLGRITQASTAGRPQGPHRRAGPAAELDHGDRQADEFTARMFEATNGMLWTC